MSETKTETTAIEIPEMIARVLKKPYLLLAAFLIVIVAVSANQNINLGSVTAPEPVKYIDDDQPKNYIVFTPLSTDEKEGKDYDGYFQAYQKSGHNLSGTYVETSTFYQVKYIELMGMGETFKKTENGILVPDPKTGTEEWILTTN